MFPAGTPGLRPDFLSALVDGSYVLHRAMHSTGAEAGPHGTAVGGVEKALRALSFLVQRLAPQRVFWVHDHGPHPERLAMFPAYKRREPSDEVKKEKDRQYRESYEAQRDLLLGVLPAWGVHVIVGPYESDDTIWYLTERHRQLRRSCTICSEDRDFVQLLGPFVSILAVARGLLVTGENWREFSKWSPEEIVIAKAVLGDPSDGVPSPCRGLGPTTLRSLFAMAPQPTLVALQAAAREKAGRARSLLEEGVAQTVVRNVQLTTLGYCSFDDEVEQVVVDREFDHRTAWVPAELIGFLKRYEMDSLLGSLGLWARYFEVLW